MKKVHLSLVAGFFAFCVLLLSSPAGVRAEMDMAKGSMGHEMTTHHQHTMMNHGLAMALEGSNMIMLGEMGMAEGVDENAIEHGKMMIKNGRSIWDETMSGKTMMKMHEGGMTPMDDPVMAYTHKLGEKELVVFELLNTMPALAASSSGAAHDMGMHHQHIILNHALKMALDGSDLIMLGQMGMATGTDEISINHGKTMLRSAKGLLNEVMSGQTMMDMHKKGMSPEKNELMQFTHRLAEAQLQVIAMLEEMPVVK